ncbi:MAG: PHP domain-containing protein [Actinomycetota bacterium]|nr:PHP domain-containing protein [Actinomycetota bacterium]
MRIDLHTHSDRSDGTDAPADVVRLAAAAGLDVVALTDHDTADGWDEAAAAARHVGVGFVPGIEISCRHAGAGVHLLAYFVDAADPALQAELGRILAGRTARLPETLRRLRAVGVDVTADDVRAASDAATALGRPHVADALVAQGLVRTRDEAFARYLSPGRPAYVDRYAADLYAMIDLVAGAGGVTVIAHPWGRQSRRVLSADTLAVLAEHGLVGIEVNHADHDDTTRTELHAIADELDLVATGSSDFHGSGKLDCPLGANLTAPQQLDRLLDAATQAARRAGRATPQVVLR